MAESFKISKNIEVILKIEITFLEILARNEIFAIFKIYIFFVSFQKTTNRSFSDSKIQFFAATFEFCSSLSMFDVAQFSAFFQARNHSY